MATGLHHPVHLAAPVGDRRLFVVEQAGRILVLEDGVVHERPFLDLRSKVRLEYERGLLSVAFHPRYRENGHFFVDYTDLQGHTRVERYTVSSDPNVADSASGQLILAVEQPYDNHNGGHLVLGPDGMLFVSLGDGGFGGDPHRNGQNLDVLLGKILRLDVDHDLPYAIPPDNPFVGRDDARPEIWAYGLRNPWRIDFDPESALLYIADSGEFKWEEVDVVPADRGALNFGWCVTEGNHGLRGRFYNRIGITFPRVEYHHDEGGCAIIGGMVYRGRTMPELAGHYFYADHCGGWIRSFRYDRGQIVDHRQWQVGPLPMLSSFGEDGAGELYAMSLEGRLVRLAFEPPIASTTRGNDPTWPAYSWWPAGS